MSKYDPLRRHLGDLQVDQWRASFDDVEKVLGASLPAAARTKPDWWAGESGAHVQAWTEGGWATADVDIAAGEVTFFRAPRSQATAQAERRPLPPPLESARTLAVRGGERAAALVEARPVVSIGSAAVAAFAVGVAIGWLLTEDDEG